MGPLTQKCGRTNFEDARLWVETANPSRGSTMAQGSKSSYTGKQVRQAKHIENGYEKRGVSVKTAEKRAWATVNKLTGGGRQSGSGRKKG
jgi:hypothetical protein